MFSLILLNYLGEYSRPFAILMVPSYDLIKRRLLQTGYFKDSIPLHLLTATLGGTISITICTPVDVIKSRVQASTGQAVSHISRLS